MFKLNIYRNKLLKIFTVLCFISLPSLSFSNEALEKQLVLGANNNEILKELLDNKSEYTAKEANNTNLTPVNKITAKSKHDFEELMGTWLLSYTDNAPHTDRIEINETTTASNGETFPIGKYYPDQTGNGSNFACADATEENSSPVYICLISITPDVNVVISMFIHENNVVTGFIGNGQTLAIAQEDMFSRKTSFTGLSISKTSANYEDNSGELYIPSVEYKGNFYRVTLEDQGNFVFELKDASSANY